MFRYRVWFEEVRTFSYIVDADDRIEARMTAKEFLEMNEEVEDEHVSIPEIVEIEPV